MENEIVIYTDGGCHGNPGPGAWACVIINEGKEHCFSGCDKQTTNNKMELIAAIQALNAVCQNSEWKNKNITIYSDSQYVKNGITSWIINWKKNGWKTAAKKPVLNKDLWLLLDSLYNQLNIQWNWVKGHAGNHYNELCDSLCQKEMSNLE
jgi:ribonuclease HI